MSLVRQLPKVDAVLEHVTIRALLERTPRPVVLSSVRALIENRRRKLLNGAEDEGLVALESLVIDIVSDVTHRLSPSLVPVINATGVVLHTNLGRAPLDCGVLAEAIQVASGYSNLEYSLQERQRGSRYTHCARLLCELTGAEDALVVNNNAASMVLMLAAMAAGREAVVSRGELVEIGGSFRLPDIFRTSGVRLIEVGTTNRTHPQDYLDAIGEQTAMLLKVHRSNFDIVGFTAEVSGPELVEIGASRGVPVCEDLGWGAVKPLDEFGIPTITARSRVEAGLDLVAFSGDKLLGGPQAGIIVGRKKWVSVLRKHPLTRAFRVDKLTLATLERTLLHYLNGTADALPTMRLLTVKLAVLEARARALMDKLVERKVNATINVEQCTGKVGGGALPMTRLSSWAVRVSPNSVKSERVDRLLRQGTSPVVCRIDDQGLLFDVRTIFDADLERLVDALVRAIQAAE
jgi:L-seryl-tRNA(Ser) seleniumtransferase